MKTSDKIRVAVLFGGRSAEHEISLLSARNVIDNLDRDQFEVIPIGIDKQGNWFLGNDIFLKSLATNTVPKLTENNQMETWFTPEWVGKEGEKAHFHEHRLKTRKDGALFDVVFPVMHGTFCEDGCLQGLLELSNLPYVGAGVLGSAIGMDKDIAKRLAHLQGIAVAPYVVIHQDSWDHNPTSVLQSIQRELNYFPLFVKPANTGSSIGVNKVKQADELIAKINEAFRFDQKVLIERAINAVELEIAVLESLDDHKNPIVSVVGQIIPQSHHEFYSYQAKYLDENGASLTIPANIDDHLKTRAREIAKILFQTLECQGMARIDLFLDKDTHEIYFNEINTIPGFTQISMYPRLMAASGISYPNLLKHLIELAIKKYKHKSKLIRSYEQCEY